MTYTDIGFVVRKHEMLNEDQVVTFFLKEKGKTSAVVKGVKKTSSRKAGSLDLLNLCKVSLAVGKNLDILTEIKIVKDYSSIKENPSKAFFLFYLDEILSAMIFDGEECQQVFALVESVLEQLDQEGDIMKFALFLNAKVLLYSGLYPETDRCIVCLKPLTQNEIVMQKTGTAHKNCLPGKEVSVNDVKVLRFLREADMSQYIRLNVPKDIQNRLFSLTTELIEYTIGGVIRSKIYINGKKY